MRSFPRHSPFILLFAFVLVIPLRFAAPAGAQGLPQTARQPRIVGNIDDSSLVTLRGNTHPFANAKNDRGAVSADFSMPDLTLVLSRSPEQEAGFEALIDEQYDPSSPSYHQWLTPAQIGEQFGPAQADIVTITSWLASYGFNIKNVAPDRMSIRFNGTAAQVESAFHTQIHNLLVKGVPHIGNMSDPQIPAALAPVVVGVKALHNFLPHSLHKAVGQARFDKQSGRWQRVTAATAAAANSNAPAPRPQFGINVPSSSNNNAYLEEDVTPWDFATIYNVTPLWSSGIDGTGQTIAIAGTSLITQSDVTTFRSDFGLPALSSFQQIDTGDGPAATRCTSTSRYSSCGIGDLDENTLDVEWSGAVAPGASIKLVVTGQNSAGTVDTVYDSAQYVVQNVTAKILNVSYGLCELGQGTTQNVAFYNLWQSAAAEGISVFVAAGDSGAPSCDQGGDSIGWPYSAQYGLSVSGLASTPYNVAVGGTDFSWCLPIINAATGAYSGCATNSSGAGPYWKTSNNTTTEPYESAAGYIPEIPWNDSCLNTIISDFIRSFATYHGFSGISTEEAVCNFVQTNWLSIYRSYGIMFPQYIDTVGGGGGASSCVVSSTNPNSTTFPSGACDTTATSTLAANGSIPLYNDGWVKPSWQAGITGIPSDGVRDLPDVSFFAADGALDSSYLVCVSADGPCTYSATSENVYQEFGGTSFGSPEMAGVMALINQKSGAPQGLPLRQLYSLASQQNYLSCSAEGPPASTCYFHSIDQGTNAMPCDNGASIGGAIYSNGWRTYPSTPEYVGTVSPNCTALVSGDTVGTLTSSSVVTTTNPSGVAYRASAGYNLATGLGTPNVANIVYAWVSQAGTAASTMNVKLSATTISANTALTITVGMTGSGSYGTPTGYITVTGGGYSTSQPLSSGSAVITIPASSLAPGTVTLTVNYGGDANYASQSQTENVTVTLINPTVLVSAPASDNAANVVIVSVTVSGPAGSPTPAGTVSLSGGTYNSSATQLSSAGVAYFSISAGALAAGSDTITATYSGSSSYYAAATGTATINIVNTAPATPTVTLTPNLTSGVTSIASGQSLSVTVTVSGAYGVPTGSVDLYALAGTAQEFNSMPVILSGSSATITIPANTLTAGTINLSASYSGDAVYSSNYSSNTPLSVTISTYALAATTPASVNPGSSTTSTITGSFSSTNYTGTVTLNLCTLTNYPSGASSLPNCTVSGTITYSAGTATGSGTATVSTTASYTAGMTRPKQPGSKGWLGAGSGAVMALLVFFGIPARRRSWRTMLSIFLALVALGTMASCGGGGGSGGGTYTVPGTSAGNYIFAVQATGNDTAKTQASTTFTVTVN